MRPATSVELAFALTGASGAVRLRLRRTGALTVEWRRCPPPSGSPPPRPRRERSTRRVGLYTYAPSGARRRRSTAAARPRRRDHCQHARGLTESRAPLAVKLDGVWYTPPLASGASRASSGSLLDIVSSRAGAPTGPTCTAQELAVPAPALRLYAHSYVLRGVSARGEGADDVARSAGRRRRPARRPAPAGSVLLTLPASRCSSPPDPGPSPRGRREDVTSPPTGP